MENNIDNNKNSDIEKLLKENLELSKKTLHLTKKINRYMILSQIFGLLKLLLIIVPIVLAILYLPPVIKDLLNQYQGILGIGGGGDLLGNILNSGAGSGVGSGIDLNNIDLNNLPPELQKLLK